MAPCRLASRSNAPVAWNLFALTRGRAHSRASQRHGSPPAICYCLPSLTNWTNPRWKSGSRAATQCPSRDPTANFLSGPAHLASIATISLVLILSSRSAAHAGPRPVDGFPTYLRDVVATRDGSAYVVGAGGRYPVWRMEPGGAAHAVDLPGELAHANRVAWSETDRILWVSSDEAVACRRADGAWAITRFPESVGRLSAISLTQVPGERAGLVGGGGGPRLSEWVMLVSCGRSSPDRVIELPHGHPVAEHRDPLVPTTSRVHRYGLPAAHVGQYQDPSPISSAAFCCFGCLRRGGSRCHPARKNARTARSKTLISARLCGHTTASRRQDLHTTR